MSDVETAPRKYSAEWWKSEDGYSTRCADYLAQWLNLESDNRKQSTDRLTIEPTWPAFWRYDHDEDAPVWIECDKPYLLKDYARAYPDRLNASAKALLDARR